MITNLALGTDPDTKEDGDGRDFDFLVQGELLQGSLENHIARRKIATVSSIRIHYTPELLMVFLHSMYSV